MAVPAPRLERGLIAARLAAIAVGFAGGILGLVFALLGGFGALQLLGLFVLLMLFIWGLNGFFFRRLPLGWVSLPLFTVAVFGVLALLGYLAFDVVRPWATDTVTRFIGLVHVADAVWYLLAFMTVAGAGGCAFSRNIIYSAWSLLFAFLGVAGMYVFLGADFPAVAQVLIYVGGILVLILFAIMLTKQIGGDPKLTNAHLGLPVGGALGAATVGTLAYMAVMAPWKVVDQPSFAPTSAGLGIAFLTEFLLPFEIASVVLLAALVGAVVIARKEIKESSEVPLT
jgi:NADH-quinone oxidoreductase subunit J